MISVHRRKMPSTERTNVDKKFKDLHASGNQFVNAVVLVKFVQLGTIVKLMNNVVYDVA